MMICSKRKSSSPIPPYFSSGQTIRKPCSPALAEGFPVDDSGLTPLFHMWHNLRCEELAIGIAEHVLFFGEILVCNMG